MKKIIIVIFGAPGSGKGYLSKCLIKDLKKVTSLKDDDFTYISVGELLREEMRSNSELGQKVTGIINSGSFVDDATIIELFGKALGDNLKTVTFLDGFPRTEGQFYSLCKILDGLPVCVINRDTPVQVIVERVSQRRVCKTCGKNFTASDLFCVNCGGELVMRDDDRAIEARLKNFTDVTEHLYELFLLCYPEDCFKVNGQQEAEKSTPFLAEIIKDRYL